LPICSPYPQEELLPCIPTIKKGRKFSGISYTLCMLIFYTALQEFKKKKVGSSVSLVTLCVVFFFERTYGRIASLNILIDASV